MVHVATKTKKAMVSAETIAHILPPLEKLTKPEVQFEGDLAAPLSTENVSKTGNRHIAPLRETKRWINGAVKRSNRKRLAISEGLRNTGNYVFSSFVLFVSADSKRVSAYFIKACRPASPSF